MPPKVKKPGQWMVALKKWNDKHNSQTWCVPKKHTPAYNEVKDMMQKKRTTQEQAQVRMRQADRKQQKKAQKKAGRKMTHVATGNTGNIKERRKKKPSKKKSKGKKKPWFEGHKVTNPTN